MGRIARIKEDSLPVVLSRLVAEGLVRLGVKQEEVLSGPIVHTNLQWQIPPLECEATLDNIPLAEYMRKGVYVNAPSVYELWMDALVNLHNYPFRVLDENGYRRGSKVLPGIRTNERFLYLSMPDGFPSSAVNEMSAVTLSLECAHVLRSNSKIASFVHTEDSYYAVLEGGIEIGVKEGLPAAFGDEWDLPVTGLIDELLATPRGAVWEGCDYDIIAKVRSLVTDLPEGSYELDGLHWALQTLRVLKAQAALLKAVQHLPLIDKHKQARLRILRDAMHVAELPAMTDRQRIDSLRVMLVPEVMKPSEFTKRVFSYSRVPPAVLQASALAKLVSGIRELLEQEEMKHGTR